MFQENNRPYCSVMNWHNSLHTQNVDYFALQAFPDAFYSSSITPNMFYLFLYIDNGLFIQLLLHSMLRNVHEQI